MRARSSLQNPQASFAPCRPDLSGWWWGNEAMATRGFGEAKIYGGLVGGTALCLWLFTVMLPALGFADFAHRFEEYADKAAPCLLSPIVAWLVVRLRERGTIPFVVALAGGVAFLFWFFVIYEPPMMLLGIALMGIGVWLGYRAYRQAGPHGPEAVPHRLAEG
jgi:hypothetical protein